MSISELAPALQRVFARAGSRAAHDIDPGDLRGLVDDTPGLLPGNGIDEPFDDVTRSLRAGTVADVLGRVAGTVDLHVVRVDDARSGARMLALLRDGSRRDVAAEQLLTDIARASGASDLVAPMALAHDARSALVQLIPHPSIDEAILGVLTSSTVDELVAGGIRAAGFTPPAALHEARIGRELAASLDALAGHLDRHPRNALVDAASGRLTLIDHELIGGGATAIGAAHHDGRPIAMLHTLLQGGEPLRSARVGGMVVDLRRVTLLDETVEHLAAVDPAAIRAAHDRFAATPPPARSGELAGWLRSAAFRDRMVASLTGIVADGGWQYVPVG